MSYRRKIIGTIENIFQLGLGGPNWKNNSGIIEARDAGDTAFAIVRGLTPSNDNDLATKNYVDASGGDDENNILANRVFG